MSDQSIASSLSSFSPTAAISRAAAPGTPHATAPSTAVQNPGAARRHLLLEGPIVSTWAADHCHTLAGGVPILALDMYEHSYHIDYGAKAADYVGVFMAAINWPAIRRAYDGLRP